MVTVLYTYMCSHCPATAHVEQTLTTPTYPPFVPPLPGGWLLVQGSSDPVYVCPTHNVLIDDTRVTP